MDSSKNKIEAVYELREAAEHKARIERDVDHKPTPENRGALLEAQIKLEAKTQKAVEACHECGHEHEGGSPHITAPSNNVLRLEPKKDPQG